MNTQQFKWDTIGHKKQRNLLEHFIVTNNVSQGYILHGKIGVGKTRLINQFIEQLYCFSESKATSKLVDSYPCGKCVHCRQYEKGIHPDIVTVDLLVDEKTDKLKKNISIEQIRKMQSKLQKSSFMNSYKVGVVYNAHTMSQGAYNSLLKTLEEPSPNTVIFLIADTLIGMPKTILSRCQLVQLYQVPQKIIADYLMQKGLNNKKAIDVAALSNGCPEIARTIVEDPLYMEKYMTDMKLFLKVLSVPHYEKFKLLEAELKLIKGNSAQLVYLEQLLQQWLVLLRDILFIKNSLQHFVNNRMVITELEKFSYKYTTQNIYHLISIIKKIQPILKQNANPQLAIENILLKFKLAN